MEVEDSWHQGCQVKDMQKNGLSGPVSNTELQKGKTVKLKTKSERIRMIEK